MRTVIGIPKRFHWAYRAGQEARRRELAAGDPNDLSAALRRVVAWRAERDHASKIRRTMDIARRLSAGEDIPARWPGRLLSRDLMTSTATVAVGNGRSTT